MPEKTNSNEIENTLRFKLRPNHLAIASLVFGVLTIPIAALSIYRLANLEHGLLCSCCIEDTPLYETVHRLCCILPSVSVIFGILALMRLARSPEKLAGKISAMYGITIAVASFIIYVMTLVYLVQRSIPKSLL